jgi:hypothetical protein
MSRSARDYDARLRGHLFRRLGAYSLAFWGELALRELASVRLDELEGSRRIGRERPTRFEEERPLAWR